MTVRLLSGPAKTMSRGSSPTRSVRVTLGDSAPPLRSTIETLSERWLTTQTVSSPATATATGSRPTITELTC